MVSQKKFELNEEEAALNPPTVPTLPATEEEDPGDTMDAAPIPKRPRLGGQEPISESGQVIGRVIAEQLEANGYHPVVIFGSSNAGKSSLLGSLFSYFQEDATRGIGIYLGAPFLPEETPYGRWAAREAETFFFKGVQEFLSGVAHAATRSEYPFFIPIRIAPKDKPELKFAFMESNGEWYKPKKDTGRYFSELKSEINTLLMHYQRGISFVYIAPYTQVDAWTTTPDDQTTNREEITDADLALVGAMNAYEKMRTFKKNDAHILLMTKWDACKRWEGERDLVQLLSDIDSAELEETLRIAYLRGFTAYHNLGVPNSQKKILQYCSGIMQGRNIVKANAEVKQILERYPQTMWNWLYANATACSPEIGSPLELLPRHTPPRKGLVDYLYSALEWLLS